MLYFLSSTMNQGSFRLWVCGAVWMDCLVLSLHTGADEMLGRIWFSRCFQKGNVDLCYWLSVFVWNWLMQHELLLYFPSLSVRQRWKGGAVPQHTRHTAGFVGLWTSSLAWQYQYQYQYKYKYHYHIYIYIFMEIWKIWKTKLAGKSKHYNIVQNGKLTPFLAVCKLKYAAKWSDFLSWCSPIQTGSFHVTSEEERSGSAEQPVACFASLRCL